MDRYVQELAAKHNIRDSSTLSQIRLTVGWLLDRNILYRGLIADDGLLNGER